MKVLTKHFTKITQALSQEWVQGTDAATARLTERLQMQFFY